MKLLVFIILSFITLTCVPTANAICSNTNIVNYNGPTPSPQYQFVSFSDTIVQKNTPVGTVLATAYTQYGQLYYGSCMNGGYVYYNMTYNNAAPSGISHVYKTNVPGVGIRVEKIGYPTTFDSPRSSLYVSASPAWFYTEAEFIVTLVATGPISPGEVDLGEIGYVSFDGAPNVKANTIYLGSAVKVIPTSCSIKTPNINVKLDDVSGAELGSVGKTAKLKNFDIGLDCEKNAKVNVKLSGNKNTDTSASGVLQLTNAGSAGVAKGVGIQMLYNNVPMVLGQNVLLKTSAGGLETFTFGTQYYQTKSDVSMGSANATATLEVTYQ